VRPVERANHCKIEQTSRLAIESGAAPNGAPAILGYELLKRSVEIVGRLKGSFHELFSKNRFANLKPTVERLLIHDVSSPLQYWLVS
jgi:phage FluMu protein gp41